MAPRNERGAGRKPKLSQEEIADLRRRHEGGESVTELAKEAGVSRQTMSAYLNAQKLPVDEICRTLHLWAKLNRQFRQVNVQEYAMRMDFMCKDECCTSILIDFQRQRIAIDNETDDVIHRAFGIKVRPTWEDFEEFLESRCFPRTRDHLRSVLEDLGLDFYDPLAIIERTKGVMAEDDQWIKITYLAPEAIL